LLIALISGLAMVCVQWTAARQTAQGDGTAAPTTTPGPLLNSILQPTGAAPLMIFPQVSTPNMQIVGGVQPATQIYLIPEGTYMLDRTGRFTPSADGRDLIFALDYNGMPTSDPTLLVLPNLERLRVEQSLVPGRDQRFIVTGLVTEYRNRNCLLLQRVRPTWEAVAPATAAATGPATAPAANVAATQTARGGSTQPTTSVAMAPLVLPTAPVQPPPAPIPTINHAISTEPAEQMLTEMLAPVEAPAPTPMAALPAPTEAPVDSTTGNGAVAPQAAALPLLREGTSLADRIGRLSRSADGKDEQIVFDSDGRNMRDPPMIILPNLKLISMEDAVLAYNKDLRFRVSGIVTEYKGRNYILLLKAVMMADSVQSF
jgi:hypothetical protein